jgi:hypothetical protein
VEPEAAVGADRTIAMPSYESRSAGDTVAEEAIRQTTGRSGLSRLARATVGIVEHPCLARLVAGDLTVS